MRPEDFDRERRRIVRKISVITWGLAAGAVVMAVVGGALVAWIFTGAGFPFLRTWLIVSVLLLAVPAAVHLLTGIGRGRKGGGTGGGTGGGA